MSQSAYNKEESGRLLRAYLANRNDLRALHSLVEANEPLVRWAVKHFCAGESREMQEDLVQEGMAALPRICEGYDLERDTQLSTYAARGLQNAFERYLREHRSHIRLPAHRQDTARALYKLERMYEYVHGVPADTDQELAEFLGCPEELIAYVREHCQLRASSLDVLVNDEDGTRSVDLTEDKNSPDPEELVTDAIDKQWRLKQVLQAIQSLETGAQQVLMRRLAYGHTLSEVAEVLKVSRERVRQIEAQAIKRVRRKLGVTNAGAYSFRDLMGTPNGHQKEKKDGEEGGMSRFRELVKAKETEIGFSFRKPRKNNEFDLDAVLAGRGTSREQEVRDEDDKMSTVTLPTGVEGLVVQPFAEGGAAATKVPPSRLGPLVLCYWMGSPETQSSARKACEMAGQAVTAFHTGAVVLKKQKLVKLPEAGGYLPGERSQFRCVQGQSPQPHFSVLPGLVPGGIWFVAGAIYDVHDVVAQIRAHLGLPAPTEAAGEVATAGAVDPDQVVQADSAAHGDGGTFLPVISVPELNGHAPATTQEAIDLRQRHIKVLEQFEATLHDLLQQSESSRMRTAQEVEVLQAAEAIRLQPLAVPTLNRP